MRGERVRLASGRRCGAPCGSPARSASSRRGVASARMATAETTRVHGGRLVSATLKAHGVSHLFTLSGGHLFSIYDGCKHDDIAIVDTRHEQTAAFAAEGWAKATRQPGVAALTAGPGGNHRISAVAGAADERPPDVVLGGGGPGLRRGPGAPPGVDALAVFA